MVPSGEVWPYLLVHLGLCVAVGIILARSFVREPDPLRVAFGVALLVCFGLGLGLGTAPRLPGGHGFAMMLAWSWTLGLVFPAALAAGAAFLLRAGGRAGWAFAAAAGVVSIATIDAFAIEPRALEVSHHVVYSDRVDKPLRIVVVADLQTDAPGEYEAMAMRAVMDERPDLVLMPGDFVQAFDEAAYDAGWADLLRVFADAGLSAPLGVFATQGDVERSRWRDAIDGAGVFAIDERGGSIRVRSDVQITGLDLRGSAQPHAIARPGPGLHIVVGHRPDFALGSVDADLLVAGHTHGGQVQLPFIGPLVTMSHVPRSWASGRTEIDEDTTLVVSRGVGMERGVAPRVRFLCRPEVVVIDVLPSTT